MPRHHAGKLKQVNKKHKGDSSKRAQKANFGAGKVASRAGKKSAHNLSTEKRQNRLNKQKQLQKNKRANVWLNKRIGSSEGPPRVIGVVSLTQYANVNFLVKDLLSESAWSSYDPMSAPTSATRLYQALYPKHKAKAIFLEAEFSVDSAIEIANMCDLLLLVVHANPSGREDEIIDQTGKEITSALRAVGLPECVAVVQGLRGYDETALSVSERKSVSDTRRLALQCLENEIHSDMKLFDHYCPTSLVPFHTHSQPTNSSNDDLLRGLFMATPRDLSWRSLRSYLLADSLTILPNENNQLPQDQCSVKVTGYLRGCPLLLHSLMQLKGVGAGRIVSLTTHEFGPIERAAQVEKMKGRAKGTNLSLSEDMFDKNEVFQSDPSRQESLILEASPDVLMGEQTWPTEDEMNAGSMADGRSRRVVPTNIIPVGMSTYQADWLLDDEGKEIHGSDGNESGDHSEGEDEEDESDGEDDMEEQKSPAFQTLGSMAPPSGLPKGFTAAEASSEFGDGDGDDITLDGSILTANLPSKKELQARRAQEAEGDDRFPDEVDTPDDIAARVRFARYRALQSFRTSPWHPKENLPQDYSRIFQFESFNSTQKSAVTRCRSLHAMQDRFIQETSSASKSRVSTRSRVNSSLTSLSHGGLGDDGSIDMVDGDRSLEEECGATVATGTVSLPGTNGDYLATGHYVTLEITNLPISELQQKLEEVQTSAGYLCLFSLLQHEYKLSLLHFTIQRSGDIERVIKSKDQLIFETPFRQFEGKTIFSESNLNCDKHKMERFFKDDRLCVASVYGPITYMPCPVMIYQRNEDGSRTLVGTGALSSVDPDRIMLKKIILTGFPIRVKKRNAVVRHLFYDPQDVRWFKPAELTTKYGHRGHIREPVGTHGLFKATFSAPIKQNDTVMLVLFKRVFPKFPVIAATGSGPSNGARAAIGYR